jgi:Pyruvate/2-oxoacid:ferredoxin oxidoreductase delta subunit
MITARTHDVYIRTRTHIRIDGRCTACGLCVLTCPERALAPAPGRPSVMNQRCTQCLACVEVCPQDAIGEAREADPSLSLGPVAANGVPS